ncbi:MAG: PKD domain-containing protein [Patescibacteria group bacterium]
MRKQINFLVGRIFVFLALVMLLPACMKDYDFSEPNVPNPDNGGFLLKSSSQSSADTTETGIAVPVIFYLENQSGVNFTVTWNFGDNSPYTTGTGISQVVHKYMAAGTYTLTVTIVPSSGSTVILTHTVLVGLNSSGMEFRCLKSVLVTSGPMVGAYNYTFGVRQAFFNPAWHVGDHSNWSQVTIANTDTMMISGEAWKIWHVVRYNGLEVQSYGDAAGNWANYPGSVYWHPTPPSGGVFHCYCYNGVVYTSQQGVNIPGLTGDSLTGVAPTVRLTVELNGTANTDDTLVVFLNNQSYFPGANPFVFYGYDSLPGNWSLRHQSLIPGSDWGFIKISINQIINSGGMYYFRAGGNYNSPSNYGNMSNSSFYQASLNCLYFQISLPLNNPGPKIYLVTMDGRKYCAT